MKVAPIVAAMNERPSKFTSLVLHTGQHYDAMMSDAFFSDLELPQPDIHLGVGSGTHAVQTASIMQRFEPVVLKEKPDWVLVVGDVNSTIACALVCVKLGIRVAHVEAGLRSRDRTMPEEINRVLTDQIADLLLTPSPDADVNLRNEGIPAERIRFVGNVMIDSLFKNLERARKSNIKNELGLSGDYSVLTLHRPANVDAREPFERIIDALESVSAQLPVIFPAHPRTRKTLKDLGLESRLATLANVRIVDPLGYLDFLALYSNARLVMTDSGGIQEETTALGIPCLTLRENTERPITIEHGTNVLVGTNTASIINEATKALNGPAKRVNHDIPLWDGHAAERILDVLEEVVPSFS